MLLLGIETSCDETAVAILRDREVLADLIASQDDVHIPFGGVVPELASRRHMEILPSMVKQAMSQANLQWSDLDGIAVTRAPGLIGCLLVGLSFAKGLAFNNNLPLIGVNHLEGHLLVAQLEDETLDFPFIGLVVSGGHTSLYFARKAGDYQLLAATRDDAAGEAYDKAAKLMGLGFPGGPAIDKLAAQGDPNKVKFSPTKTNNNKSKFAITDNDFSFSGLKTAVRYMLDPPSNQKNKPTPPKIADLAAGFQNRVIEEIITRLKWAIDTTGCTKLVVAGGVAANKGLRGRLELLRDELSLQLVVPRFRYCTDNAVMIAWGGMQQLMRGETDALDINVSAVEELGGVQTSS